MDALDVETRIAEAEQALQARLQFAREDAGTLEAHDAEQGLFKRLLPMGLAAMQLSFAQRGTGDMGTAITRADGVTLPQEPTLRGRDDCSLFGKCTVARTCDRTAGDPGIFPLDAQVNLPERCDSYVLPEWMTVFAVEHPFQESSAWFEPRVDREGAESVLREVAQEAPMDDESFYAQRPVPPEATAGALLVVRVDGKGVPMIKAEAVKLKAKLGTGAKRQQKKAALVGVSDTVDPKPRWPEALAELLVEPEAARARRRHEDTRDEAPRAQQVRRVASLVRTKQKVRELIKADAARRDPQHRKPLVLLLDGALGLWRLAPRLFTPWKRVTCVLDIRPVVGDLWAAANAWCGEASQVGQHGVQRQLTAMLRGWVGDVIGGLRQLLTKPRRRQSVRETRGTVITCLHNHRRWMPYDQYLAMGLPVGTGVVESACGSVVKPRMEGEGKRWSLQGAAAILAWRSLKKSHDDDLRDDWRFHARQVRLRLYGRQPKYRSTERFKRVASLDSKRLRSSRILAWPQLPTRYAPLSVGRDIPRTSSAPDHPCV
jgi:hypothetical protein